MLVGQVKDESKAVVKCALSILEEAYSVPVSTFVITIWFLKHIIKKNKFRWYIIPKGVHSTSKWSVEVCQKKINTFQISANDKSTILDNLTYT